MTSMKGSFAGQKSLSTILQSMSNFRMGKPSKNE
jgi:hypothetical protein